MALVVLSGATGSPGVTTTALGLTLAWPRDVLLSDCDRHPSQAISAGYLRGLDVGGRGLTAITRLHRENQPIAPELGRQSVPLTKDGSNRRFLPGFSQPPGVELFESVWDEFTQSLAGLDSAGIDAIVDAGRIGSRGLPAALVSRAAMVCVVVRASLRSLAGLRLFLPILSGQVSALAAPPELGLLLVGANRPYGTNEISAQFAVPCFAELPWEPKLAEVLSDGEPPPRKFENSALMDGYRSAASHLSQHLQHRHSSQQLVTGRSNA